MSGAVPTAAARDDAVSIVEVDRLDLRFAQRPWRFATERRREIDAFFAARQKQRTGMWNGRVMLMYDAAMANGTFRGTFFEIDYAAYHAWCSWDFPDGDGVRNGFSAGALRTADGAFVLGEMGRQTAYPGSIYFPCGTPDLSDVSGSRVDLDASMRRELREEIGIGEDAYAADRAWFVVDAGPRVALIKVLRAHEPAEALHRRIAAHLAREATPELAGIRMARSPADFNPRMPRYTTAFLSHVWGT